MVQGRQSSCFDTNDLLAILSKNLEASLQQAFDLAAQYNGLEPPQIKLDKDFDLQTLDAAQVGQYLQLYQNDVISHETLLGMLKKGEVLPQLDVELEMEMVSQQKLDNVAMMMPMGNPQAAAPGEEEEEEEAPDKSTEAPSEMRTLLEERIRRMNGESKDEEEDG